MLKVSWAMNPKQTCTSLIYSRIKYKNITDALQYCVLCSAIHFIAKPVALFSLVNYFY